MHIRNATRADLPDIITIYNSTVASRMVTADIEPVSIESRIPWFEAHNTTNRPLWVAELENIIIGWLSFQSFYGRPAYLSTVEVSIYVAETNRHKQIGRNLMHFAIEKASFLGVKTLLGFIFAHNEPSLRLFESCGFQRWGLLPQVAQLDGKNYDLAILGMNLHHFERE